MNHNFFRRSFWYRYIRILSVSLPSSTCSKFNHFGLDKLSRDRSCTLSRLPQENNTIIFMDFSYSTENILHNIFVACWGIDRVNILFDFSNKAWVTGSWRLRLCLQCVFWLLPQLIEPDIHVWSISLPTFWEKPYLLLFTNFKFPSGFFLVGC